MNYAECQVLNYSDQKLKGIDVCRLAGTQLIRPENGTLSPSQTQVVKQYSQAGRQAGLVTKLTDRLVAKLTDRQVLFSHLVRHSYSAR